MAAKAAHPQRQVVCVIGDGSVGLNFAEFDTAVRHNLAITVVINNDIQWGMSKHGQDLAWGAGNTIATELGVVHYERAACVNIMTDPEVIEPGTLAMSSVLNSGKPPKAGDKAEVAPEAKTDETMLPYYGKHKIDRP